MSIDNGPNLGVMVDGLLGEQHYADLMKFMRGLDGLVQCRVLDKDLTAPPGSPTNGAMYIVAAAPTGAWAGQAGKIARYYTAQSSGPGWEFYTPKKGWRAHVDDEGVDYQYDGAAWVAAAGGGTTEDAVFTGTTKNEYLTAGDGITRDANSTPGDDPHWVEITNNPATGAGKQLFRMNSYGASGYGNNVHFCRYGGTEAAPSAIGSGSFLMSIGYRGHDGTALSQSAAAFQVLATEDWNGTAHGCKFQWQTTPDGSTTRSQAMELTGNELVIQRRVGIAVTPAAWHANYKVLEFGLPGCAMRGHATTPECTMTSNAYYDTSYKYGSTAAATIYQQVGGTHNFLAAPSGSAGAAVTFTQIMLLSAVTGTGYNAAAAALKVNKDVVTDRSINAAGTVNASGADYAEYMVKTDNCGVIAKGQIVGINALGQITDIWVEAVTFMIKSTNPAYVGGDVWGSGAGIDAAPDHPGPDATVREWRNYRKAIKDLAVKLEARRHRFDRIAFAGQVPVNVLGADAGDYIVPVQAADAIAGIPVKNPNLEQYMMAVGKVIAIESDGRALVIVKVA